MKISRKIMPPPSPPLHRSDSDDLITLVCGCNDADCEYARCLHVIDDFDGHPLEPTCQGPVIPGRFNYNRGDMVVTLNQPFDLYFSTKENKLIEKLDTYLHLYDRQTHNTTIPEAEVSDVSICQSYLAASVYCETWLFNFTMLFRLLPLESRAPGQSILKLIRTVDGTPCPVPTRNFCDGEEPFLMHEFTGNIQINERLMLRELNCNEERITNFPVF